MLDLSKISEAIRHEGGISRRLFLAYGAALAALPKLAEQVGAADERVRLPGDPFTLGVASGDPIATGVVLWTRLAPKPLEIGGGMRPEPVAVSWELADDEGMKKVLRSGTVTAVPQLGHSVHVELQGLAPDRWYWYRFRAGDAVSPVGRTRTLPAADASPEKLRFAFASCQNFEQGLFTAYEQMAKDDLDLVVHLGDYIYEYAGKDNLVRKHLGKEIESLDDYRTRHAQYRGDPLLQAMHLRTPWLVTWDDHEFQNNCAGAVSAEGVDPAEFLERRANAYQAYYEMMPLPRRCLPRGPDMQLYRQASFGRLAQFFVLDTRQYRTDQPNGDRPAFLNRQALNPKNTLLGARQRGWLQAGLLESPTRWNVLAQQVMMGMAAIDRDGEWKYSMDQWCSAAHERMALVKWIAERRVPNPVVLTGDIHSNWVNDLRIDDRNLKTPIVATEFVGSSISSGGNGLAKPKTLDKLLGHNPFIRFHNTERGYVRCTVTPKEWRSDYVAVEDVLKPGGKVLTRATFAVEAGKPGAHLA